MWGHALRQGWLFQSQSDSNQHTAQGWSGSSYAWDSTQHRMASESLVEDLHSQRGLVKVNATKAIRGFRHGWREWRGRAEKGCKRAIGRILHSVLTFEALEGAMPNMGHFRTWRRKDLATHGMKIRQWITKSGVGLTCNTNPSGYLQQYVAHVVILFFNMTWTTDQIIFLPESRDASGSDYLLLPETFSQP